MSAANHDRGISYGWDDVIEFPRDRAKNPAKPRPHSAATVSLAEAQSAALAVLSAAAQRPDAEALTLLEGIPDGAWGCSPELHDLAKMLIASIRAGVPDPAASLVLAEAGTDAHPWSLVASADAFTGMWEQFHDSTRTLPRDAVADFAAGIGAKTEPEVKIRAALPAFTDISGWWELAEKPLPSVFREHMTCGELCIIGGAPGTGKTQGAIGLGASVVFGRSMLAGFTPHRRGRVAFYLGEDSNHPTAQRVRAWCEYHGIGRDEFLEAVADGRLNFLCGESADLLSFQNGTGHRTQAHAELVALCKREQYDLVVIDSLIQWAAVPNENDNSMMQIAGRALVEIARELKHGAVLALAHSNKASDQTGEVGLHSIRGGSALAGKCRWAAILQEMPARDCNDAGIHKNEHWKYARLNFVKIQYGAKNCPPMILERMAGGVLEAVNLVPPPPEDTLLPLAKMMADCLGDNPADLTKWQIIQEKPGKEFRSEMQVFYGKSATIKNLGLAYNLAVHLGLLVEENGSHEAGGNVAIIPRQAVTEKAEYDL